MTNPNDAEAIRQAVAAWLDAWTFGEPHWDIRKFEKILTDDIVVLDDFGHKLWILNGIEDYRTIWGKVVKENLKEWKIAAEGEIDVRVGGDTGVAIFVLAGGGTLTNGEPAKLRQHCTFVYRRENGAWKLEREHISTDFDYH